MSNLWFNIRFGKRHFQLTNDWEVSFKVNRYWLDHRADSWFEVYCLFGKELL